MSLDIILKCECCNSYVLEKNITHNLTTMAEKVGVYKVLWRPEELNLKYAKDIIEKLEASLIELRNRPKYFKKFNASNGWGTYEDFCNFIKSVLEACKKYPNAKIIVSR